jgi:hypothetical protein
MLRVWNLLETRVLYKTLRTLVPADQIELLQRYGSTAIPCNVEPTPGSSAIRRC